MPTPFHSVVVPAPIEEVWPIFRDFAKISDWHPAVEDSHLVRGTSGAEVAAQRGFTLADGGEHVVEELLALDDQAHTLTFEVVSGPYPVRDYISTQRITPIAETGHTLMEWSVTSDVTKGADPDEVAEAVRTVFFVAGLDAIKNRFA